MGPEAATLHVLPTIWFRNDVVVGRRGCRRPRLRRRRDGTAIRAAHPELGDYLVELDAAPDGSRPELLFCENETNVAAHLRPAADHAVSQGRHQRPPA